MGKQTLWVPVRINAFNRSFDPRWSIAKARDVAGSKYPPMTRREAMELAKSLESPKAKLRNAS